MVRKTEHKAWTYGCQNESFWNRVVPSKICRVAKKTSGTESRARPQFMHQQGMLDLGNFWDLSSSMSWFPLHSFLGLWTRGSSGWALSISPANCEDLQHATVTTAQTKCGKKHQVPTGSDIKKLQILSSDGTDIADTHSMPTTGASSEQIEVKDEREATPSSYGSYRVWWMRIGSQRMAFGYLEIPEDTC
jgi:hypothetical protein